MLVTLDTLVFGAPAIPQDILNLWNELRFLVSRRIF
jgi:hypothetical protein